MSRTLVLATLGLIACQPNASGQDKPAEQQIAEAVMALPEPLRAGAAVKGYKGGELVDLRAGNGEMICLADAPGDERWHVACYHKDLEPFMARGRELRAEGVQGFDERYRVRFQEIEAGELQMPEHPAALYSLTGDVGAYDPATGAVTGARGLQVIYMPYATQETVGITVEPSEGRPWLMLPGTPAAHVMIPRG